MKVKALFLFITICSICRADIIQFDASASDSILVTNISKVVSWRSVNSPTILSPVHENSSLWSQPRLETRRICFNDASPLEFVGTDTNLYNKIIVVADCNSLMLWSTLIDTIPALAANPVAFSNEIFTFSTTNCIGSSSIIINGDESTEIPINSNFIVEFVLSSPTNLNNIFIGGSPATPYWNRSWDGCIYELLLLNKPLTEQQYSALYTYLSLKYKIEVSVPLCADSYGILKGLGVKAGSVFTTIILWRQHMELLLLVAKYGVITAAFLVVASSASKELSLLFARIRKQSKFVQLCVFAFIMTAVVYGGSKPSTNSVSTSTEPLNSFNSNVSSTHSATTSTHTLPQWYIEHGYPSTDTDGDGIPDAWERWTHTKPLSNDALVDYDGDGVDNITEFMYMCDPIRSDTDGDGLDDNMEIDGMLAGLDDFNPLVPSTFLVEEEYTPGLTICDIWSNYAYVNGFNLFSDEDNNGFDDEYEERMPYPSELTFDVSLTITTTRTALLSWENDGIIIPPCTNKVVKLRLDGSVDTGSIDLIAHPEGASLSGLWKAQMVVEYDLRYSQESEQKRIKLRNGYYVDFDTMESEFIGYINSAQQYGRRNQNC